MAPARTRARGPTRQYGGVSAAERRARRRARLLAAGLELLGARGWRKTTVRAICARARLTERYFYESFDDREALLLAVFDAVAAEATDAVLAAVEAAPHDPRAKSRAAIAAFVELMTEDPRKGRVAFIEAMSSEALMARRLKTMSAFAELLAAEARRFYGEGAPRQSDVALTAHALVGAVAELLLGWLNGALEVSRERLIDHCTELFAAAARVRSSP